jgi:hypothetical protein
MQSRDTFAQALRTYEAQRRQLGERFSAAVLLARWERLDREASQAR